MNDPVLQPKACDRANTFPWPPVLLLAVIGAAWLLSRIAPLPWPGLDDAPAHFVGLGFGVVGLALITWSVVTLISSGTTVMPDQTSTALVTFGPYKYFRNPIYLGEVLVLLSLAEITHSIWYVGAALVFAVLVTLLQIGSEERHLEAQFGERYHAYRARTRRWI